MHEHAWSFTFRAGGYDARCPCGLALAVEEHPDGRSVWEWTHHGRIPPPAMMLDAIPSVGRARRAWHRTRGSPN